MEPIKTSGSKSKKRDTGMIAMMILLFLAVAVLLLALTVGEMEKFG